MTGSIALPGQLLNINVTGADDDRFIERRLGDSLALFDTTSGETHLISPSALTLLKLLENFSGTRGMLLEELACHIDGTQQEIQDFLDRTLGNLEDIGLIKTKAPL